MCYLAAKKNTLFPFELGLSSPLVEEGVLAVSPSEDEFVEETFCSQIISFFSNSLIQNYLCCPQDLVQRSDFVLPVDLFLCHCLG